MPIRVKCESCKKTLSVKDHLAGKKIKCPVCQSVIAVTAMASMPAKEAPAKDAPTKEAPPKAAPTKAAPAKDGSPAKKPGVAAKSAKTTKPVKAQTNGKTKPANGKPAAPAKPATGNGTPPKSEPAPVEPPPEHVEAEALAAFADEPAPPPEETTPQTIDFKCQWCDEEVKMPIDMAGKQTPCPHPECKRIIKVPLPKVEGKKDWRKMDRRGPAAAIINQPEELENAWGTETSTRARQDSLRQAGAIDEPEREPVGLVGWALRGAYVFIGLVILSAAVVGILRLRSNNQQYAAIEEIDKVLLNPKDLKIKDSLLRAEAHRALGILYLREPDRSKSAMQQFDGARGLIAQKLETNDDKKDPLINEQLFLIDLALSQVELGGDGDDLLTKKKQDWDTTRGKIKATLMTIRDPEVQVMALREVGTRLFVKKQEPIAFQLAGNFSQGDVGAANQPMQYRQEIALLFASTGEFPAKAELLKKKPELQAKDKEFEPHLAAGFAEGYARTGDFDAAYKLATAPVVSTTERLDACLGVASIALGDAKNKAEAEKFHAEAVAIMNKDKLTLPWQQLQIVKIAARLDKADSVKDMIAKMEPAFKLRAQYEVFLAKCEKGSATPDDLAPLEADDKDGATLGLAWMALTRQNGASRDQNRKTFDNRSFTPQKNVTPESFRPMADIGSYLGPKR
jgi:DNA-directed RNA polymerase subunit RPC12/RpoP